MQRAPNSTISVQQLFSKLDNPVTPRSTFDRSFPVLTTLDAGYLVPLYWDNVLPSDTIELKLNMFGRVNTLIKPIYDNLYMDVHAFFVPNRLLQLTWTQVMGEQPDPENPVTKTVAQISFANAGGFTGVKSHTLANYLTMPIGYTSPSKTWSCLPFRAYYKIYDDLYRDENFVKLQLPYSSLGDATVAYNDTTFPLLKRFKRKDYFTSMTPEAQNGDPVTLPLGGTAEVWGTSAVATAGATNLRSPVLTTTMRDSGGVPYTFSGQLRSSTANSGTAAGNLTSAGTSIASVTNTYDAAFLTKAASQTIRAGALAPMQADLTTTTGITVNMLREFITLQQYLEREMRAGKRYTESLYSTFGVTPEDSRLQRAEYLFGKTFDLMVTPIAQTSESASGTPQANLSGMGTFNASGSLGTKSFAEHGIFMIIASVRQEQRYQQGISRKFDMESQYDFYDPLFANLGEQGVKNFELYADGTATDLEIAGYQQAWAHERYNPAVVTGKMSSLDPVSLDSWHLAQKFDTRPTLGRTFLEENVPMDRVVAVTDEPDFTLQGIIEMMHTRPLPQRSIPGLTKL